MIALAAALGIILSFFIKPLKLAAGAIVEKAAQLKYVSYQKEVSYENQSSSFKGDKETLHY